MAKYIEVEFDDQIIKFEINSDDLSGEMAVSSLPQKIRNILPELQNTVKGVSVLVTKAVASLHEPPAETVVEFGINVKAEVGAMVASSSTEAQIKVSLKWKKDGKS